MSNFGIIYVIKNNINGLIYVGQTINSVRVRLCSHKNLGSSIVGRAIRKHGIDKFSIFEFQGIPLSLLDYCEISLIERFKSMAPNGYNLSPGGRNNIGGLSSEHKRKIGEKAKGRKLSAEAREKISKSKIGKPSKLRGAKLSKETKIKISLSRLGLTPWNKGRPWSDEMKKKISESLIGRDGTHKKRVICVETGVVYNSLTEAAIDRNVFISNLCTCLSGRLKTTGGVHWEYYEEDL